MNITLGSNHFIETNGIIVYVKNGKERELFKYELRSSDSKPLVDVEIRDAYGKLLGKGTNRLLSFLLIQILKQLNNVMGAKLSV